MFGKGKNKNQSLRPKRKLKKNSTLHRLHQAKKTLDRKSDFENRAKCPEGERMEHWIHVHIVDFYNAYNRIIGPIESDLELCTKPMCCGSFQYLWKDDKIYKKPTAMIPLLFINTTLDYIEQLLNNKKLFPEDDDAVFPKHYEEVTKDIFKKLFRVYAHVVLEQWVAIQRTKQEQEVTLLFQQFIIFCLLHKTIRKKELEPLHDWIGKNMDRKWCKKLKVKYQQLK